MLAWRVLRALKARCFDDPLLNGLFVDDVLVNDLVDFFCGDLGVPDAIWPYQENRAFLADSQAVNFASENHSFRSILVFESKLLDESFQFIPGR